MATFRWIQFERFYRISIRLAFQVVLSSSMSRYGKNTLSKFFSDEFSSGFETEERRDKKFRAEDIRDERPPSLSNLFPLFEGFVSPYWKVDRLSAFWSRKDGSPGKPTVEFQFAPGCVKERFRAKKASSWKANRA